MGNFDRPKELLAQMKERAGSKAALIRLFLPEISEKSVRKWLTMSDQQLRRLQPESIRKIEEVAIDLKIEPRLFGTEIRLWDPGRSYDDNVREDPQIPSLSVPWSPGHQVRFLGHVLRSAFGASASVLTANAARVRYLAATGCDVITYKTVRSTPYPSLGVPNIFYCRQGIDLSDEEQRGKPVIVDYPSTGSHPRHGMLNRFAMPSPAPEVWQVDFRVAKSSLQPGQLLILSVVATAKKGEPDEVLIADFVKVVQLAIAVGADVIELNFSCPNCSREGAVYRTPTLAGKICEEVKTVSGKAKILVKIGYLVGDELRALVDQTAPYVSGYTAINTIAVESLRDGQEGLQPAYGQGIEAGLSGRPILRHGLRCVDALAKIREADRLKIAIIGIGGITEPQDVKSYLDAGADAVQATTAFFNDSLFAVRVRNMLDQEQPRAASALEQQRELALHNWAKAETELNDERARDRAAVGKAALEVWSKWKEDFDRTAAMGPRRGPAPTVEDFKTRIRRLLPR